jgi:hypothetical protein
MQLIYGIMNHVRGCWILSTTQYPLGLSRLFFFFFFFHHVNSFCFIILLSCLMLWPIGLDNKYIKSSQLSFIFIFIFIFIFHVNSFSFQYHSRSYLLLLYGPSAWTINILSPHNCHSIFLKIFYTHNMNAIMFVSLHKRYSKSNN